MKTTSVYSEREAVVNNDELSSVYGALDDSHGTASTLSYGKAGGLSVLATTVFLVGEMAGSGILALPHAVVNANWIGIPVILLCGILAGYNGINLGRCWNMTQQRWPRFRSDTRDPYPAMGEMTFGRPMRYIVRFCMYATLFGGCTVFLLLASQNVQSILKELGGKHFSFCYWLLIIAAVLTPCVWLGTPKDFWPIGTGAGIATALACIIAVVAMLTDHRYLAPTHSGPSFQSFFLAFGAILFAFGGASTFPTVQHDMKDPSKFHVAAIAAFSCLLLMYLPVASVGYFVYGDSVNANILQSLPPGALRITVEILITGHLVLAFVVVLNPISQDLEEWLNFPAYFNWRRVLVRTILVGLILFAAQSVPHFGAILDFIGGSTVTFLTFVAPPLFYLRLRSMTGDWAYEPLPLHVKVLNMEVIGIGIIGGITATYSAIMELSSASTFVPPCYVDMAAAEGK